MRDPARPKICLQRRTKGYELRHEDGYQVFTLSAMDAAKLLFQIKDELRRTSLGRGCVDRVAALRIGRKQ